MIGELTPSPAYALPIPVRGRMSSQYISYDTWQGMQLVYIVSRK